jgi:hypothetical protein
MGRDLIDAVARIINRKPPEVGDIAYIYDRREDLYLEGKIMEVYPDGEVLIKITASRDFDALIKTHDWKTLDEAYDEIYHPVPRSLGEL